MVISVLVGALVYSSISAFNVFAVPDEAPLNADCETTGIFTPITTCCWTETDPDDPEEGIELNWCQSCSQNGCNDKYPAPLGPTRPPTGPAAPLQGGVLEQPPTPPPGPAAPLQDGGVLQQTPGQGAAPPGTTAAPAPKPEVACGPPPMPACGPNSPPQPPPPPPTNHVVRGPQVEEAELPPATEGTQSSTLEEEQPVPVCQEGLEFNEGLGFCVPTECPEGQVLDEETGICVLEEPEVAEEPAESQPEQEQPSEESGSEGDNSNN